MSLEKILNIITDKTENSPSISVMDLAVIEASGLPESEARKYISELEGLQMITVGMKVNDAEKDGKQYGMLNLKTKGLEALQDQD